jgi:alpha-L-fucosidase
VVSLDIGWPAAAQQDAYGVAKLARRLQPNVLLRQRGIGPYGDYETPEGTIPEDPRKVKRPWQVIYPCGTGFSYKKNDRYKSKEWVLASLIDIVAKGGNFQVGFGPRPDGTWPQDMIDRVSYVGDWLKVNGQCIYATQAWNRWHEGKDVRFTRSKDGKFVYAIALKWPGSRLTLASIKPREGTKIVMLGIDKPLAWRMDDKDGLAIDIPETLQAEANRPCKQAYAFRIEGDPR